MLDSLSNICLRPILSVERMIFPPFEDMVENSKERLKDLRRNDRPSFIPPFAKDNIQTSLCFYESLLVESARENTRSLFYSNKEITGNRR